MIPQEREANERLQRGDWPGWPLVLAEVVRPIVGLALLAIVLRGSRAASWVLAFFLVIRLVRLITARVPQWFDDRRARGAPVIVPIPCVSPCACGCGLYAAETDSFPDCGRPCACGCGRPCRRHVGHGPGEACFGRPDCPECGS